MSNVIYGLTVSAAGKTPNVTGDKRLTLLNWINLISGVMSGSRLGSGNGYAKVSTANATGTFTCASVVATDTCTVNGTLLTAEQERATGTATLVSAVAGNTVTINGVTFTAQSSAATLGTLQWDIRTSDTAAATSLAAQVNAYSSASLTGLITATSALGVVTFRAVSVGTAANSYTLAKVGAPITVSNTTLLGGLARSNNKFDASPGATNTQTAVELALCINSSSTALVSGLVSATSAAAVVTVSSLMAGVAGNAMTIANSAHATASGARLTGGTTTTFVF